MALVLGPLLGGLVAWLVWASLGAKGAAVLGLLAWMATWWLTLAVDLSATALLPIVLLPTLGVSGIKDASAPYADGVIFLFAGGFILSIALERHGLSVRFARLVVGLAGTSGANVVGALMLATALVSAFVSNTATAAALLPVAMALARGHVQGPDEAIATAGRRAFAAAAILGVAYASSIGGVLTLIGSPPNAIASQFIAKETGEELTFSGWLRIGAPVGLTLLPLSWLVLTRWAFPCRDVRIDTRDFTSQPPLDRAARRVLTIFTLTVVAWMTRPLWAAALPGVRDETISVAAALALMITPSGGRPTRPLIGAHDLRDVPWGVLILFGGGLSIAAAIETHGVATWLAGFAGGLSAAPTVVILLCVATIACFFSEVASNTALAATAMPVMAALAKASDSPVEGLAITAALGASLAFMLPVGTPPNAMAYATGEVSSRSMARVGFVLNLLGIAVVTAVCTIIR